MPKQPDPLHKYRRHAQLYGASQVYETATEEGFTPMQRAALACYLHKLEPRERRASRWQLTGAQRQQLRHDLALAGIDKPPSSAGINATAVAKARAAQFAEAEAKRLLKHGPVGLFDSHADVAAVESLRAIMGHTSQTSDSSRDGVTSIATTRLTPSKVRAGHRFGWLEVLETWRDDATRKYLARVVCDCGSPAKTVRADNLTTGNTTACGCRHREYLAGVKATVQQAA